MADALESLARTALGNAHAPYSRFRVGAALEAADGRRFFGCNVENASYGLTICAERAAVAAAVAEGVRRLARLVIVTERGAPSPPCGACRQVLAEFGTDLAIRSVSGTAERSWRLADLLPEPFGLDEKGKEG
ncbi:MAG TPA: cytidine deaminase [Gemmatimonadales bacterium]|nr:cytidine deaminase [Gemmatimonadales bacterium]